MKPCAVPILDSKPTFTVHEDENTTPPYTQVNTEEIGERAGGPMEMVQLSPVVEVRRKGRGRAKRDRCASYLDEDIIGRGDAPSEEASELGVEDGHC